MRGYSDNIRLAITAPMVGHVQAHHPNCRRERAPDLAIGNDDGIVFAIAGIANMLKAAAKSGNGHIRIVPAEWVQTRHNDLRLDNWLGILQELRLNEKIKCVTPHARKEGILAKAENLNIVFCQFAPWQFDYKKLYNLKRTFRRTSYLLMPLLANMGAAGQTLERFSNPIDASKAEKRCLEGLYIDVPEEWDDPYRFFRWLRNTT